MVFHISRFTIPVSRLMPDVSRVTLLLLLVAAFALRVHHLAAQSLWYDEAVTAYVAGQELAGLTRWTAEDIQPPLYYYVVAGWTTAAGRSEWALRFPSVAWGVLTVVLAWALARRLLASRAAALLAALLAAASPLHVYYAQEARMYTQLTCLGMLSGYAVVRAFTAGRLGWRWWGVFAVAAAAALYTHYFAAFLLLAYALCVLAALVVAAVCGRRNMVRQAVAALLSGLTVVLLYLPWLPAMLTRYRVDRSYWHGALKLGEALRHVAISFTAGAPEMMLEPDAVRLLPGFGLALAAALIGLAWPGRSHLGPDDRDQAGALASSAVRRRDMTVALLLLVCLLVPVLGILALASRTPKFNARYLMLASPAHLLLLAGGMAAWMRRPARGLRRVFSCAVPAVILGFYLWVSFTSLRNWFGDWAFAKAQWRELTAVVRSQMAADETVVLVSGHAWPAWDYYAPDLPRLRLPALDILDVEAVLGFDDGPALGQALVGKRGVWLVRWQAEAVDPVGFAAYFLDRIGVEQPQPHRFWHLELRHWRLHEDTTIAPTPMPAHLDGANYAHKLALIGWDDPTDRSLTVYWLPLNRMTADYQVSLILLDEAGLEVGRWDGRPAGYDYPTTRWRPGRPVFGRYPLPLPEAAASGNYYVSLAVYDAADPAGLDIRDVADNPAGKRVRLGPLRLSDR